MNWSRLCSPQSRNSSSSLTLWGHCIHSYRRSTSPTSYSTGRESLGCQFASGIAFRKYRRHGCDLNSFSDISQRTDRDVRSHCWRYGYASCQHGVRYHFRDIGSLTTIPRSDRDSNDRAGACGSCIQGGAKYPTTDGHTAAQIQLMIIFLVLFESAVHSSSSR